MDESAKIDTKYWVLTHSQFCQRYYLGPSIYQKLVKEGEKGKTPLSTT